MTLSHSENRSPLTKVLPYGALLFAALLSFRSIDDLDYGIHMATGRWILKHGTVPETDPFSWSFSHHAYIAYHWAFQVLIAYLDSILGLLGPIILRCLLILGTCLAVWKSLKTRGIEPLIGVSLALLAIIAAEWRFSIRPELFSNLLIACTVLSLDMREGLSRRLLYLLPLIFLVWINTHIYILGFVVAALYLFEDLITGRSIRTLAVALALSGIALFLNPYGLDAILEPVKLFTRMDSSNAFAQHISELSSPFNLPSDPRSPSHLHAQLGSWICLLLLSIPALWGLVRLRRWADAAIIVIFAVLSMTAIRNLPLFVIAALPALATGMNEILPLVWPRVLLYKKFISSALLVILGVMCVRVASGAWYAVQRRNLHLAPKLETASLAIDSSDFVRTKALSGKGFNNLDVGGALLLRAPEHKIFIDGRNEVTGEEFFKRYLALLEPNNFPLFATQEEIEYAVLSHRQTLPLIQSLISSGLWTLAHYDAVAVVLVRKAGPNGHLQPQPLPEPIRDEAERWKFLDEIFIRASYVERFSRWLLGGEELPEHLSKLGTFLLMLGQWSNAERPLLEAAVKAPDFWETSNNLGALYTRLKEWEAATFVYRSVLMLNPGNPRAQERARESWVQFQQSMRSAS